MLFMPINNLLFVSGQSGRRYFDTLQKELAIVNPAVFGEREILGYPVEDDLFNAAAGILDPVDDASDLVVCSFYKKRNGYVFNPKLIGVFKADIH